MDASSALLVAAALALLSVVVWWIAAPLVKGVISSAEPDPRAVALLARREAILASLRDLEADHRDGRLSDQQYGTLRQQALSEGSATLVELDSLAEESEIQAAAVIAELEADVAALAHRDGGDSDVTTREVSYCPACGGRCAPGARYCAGCGERLPRAAVR